MTAKIIHNPLSEDEIADIRARYRHHPLSPNIAELAHEYGISQNSVRKIAKGKIDKAYRVVDFAAYAQKNLAKSA